MRIHNKDANTIELRFKNGNVFFFSYETPVAARIDSRYYKTSKHHSSTTTRHINRFLHGDTVNATVMKSRNISSTKKLNAYNFPPVNC